MVNATAGRRSVEALRSAGAENLAGKVLIDVANPLDSSRGCRRSLAVCNDDSLAEQIQPEFPDARVVKTLNTVNASVMVDPSPVGEDTDMFVSGDDEGAKAEVTDLLGNFGWTSACWTSVASTAARGMEMYLPLWLRLWQATGTGHLNVKVVRAE